PSKTTGRLHFSDLDPSRFEDLCLNIVYPLHSWHDIRHYGRSGADAGVDILGIELLDNGQPRTWYIQCRRYKQASIATLKKAVNDSLQAVSNIPDVVLVVVACDVSRTAHNRFILIRKRLMKLVISESNPGIVYRCITLPFSGNAITRFGGLEWVQPFVLPLLGDSGPPNP